jgi:hypothetical protein
MNAAGTQGSSSSPEGADKTNEAATEEAAPSQTFKKDVEQGLAAAIRLVKDQVAAGDYSRAPELPGLKKALEDAQRKGFDSQTHSSGADDLDEL